MRNPSWRCPHCNQSVCYPEIRLDQNMVKILKDAGQNAVDVIIEASGTWKVAKESNATEEPVRDVIIHDLEDPNSFLNSGPVVLDLTGDDDDDAEIELFGDTTKVVDRKPSLLDAQGQSNNNNASKDASDEDYSSLFNLSDMISLDQEIIAQEYSNLSQIPVPHDPISQTPSPRDRPAPTSTVFTVPNPSPQLSQAHALPVTSSGTSYLGRTSNQRWNASQAPSMTPSLQSRRHPVPVTSQSPANVSSSHIPRVLTSQPNSYLKRSLNSNHVSSQRQRSSSPPVQSVNRTSDLMDVDSTTPDTTNWRPRMRGSLTPGSYSPALDHMIIRPTQQSQTRLHGSQPAQTPPVQTSQAQPHFSTAPPNVTRPSGPTAPWRT
uniref:SP-RING-type domain-containing protein n=1 Tax=Noccaea caerulescens TaxID=107243 RepID=A0A1J3CCS6_NOCCA